MAQPLWNQVLRSSECIVEKLLKRDETEEGRICEAWNEILMHVNGDVIEIWVSLWFRKVITEVYDMLKDLYNATVKSWMVVRMVMW